jgi:peptidoglycan/xylan/chitin deacetylase (PgdA/CDA1 family)
MAWLAKHRVVVGLAEAVQAMDRRGKLPRGVTALTFDDGLSGLHEYVFPSLRTYRLPATAFLVAETLTPRGRGVDWVDTPPPFPLRTVTPDQVIEMRNAGVDFGSHSYAHHDLTRLDESECEADLRRSREVLERLLGAPVHFLAYPRGRHNEVVRRAAAAAGFSHGFALERDAPILGPAGPPHAIPRVGVFPGNGPRTIRMKTSRWYLPVRESGLYPTLRRLAGRPPRSPGSAG